MMKRFFTLFFILTMLLSALTLPSFAAKQEKAVYDLAGMFTDSEIEAMENAARQYFGDTNCSVYIVTEDNPFDVEYWGEDFVRDYLGGHAGNSVILIITNNYASNYNLYTYGKCDRRISDSEVDAILDDPIIYGNIKGQGDYKAAVTEFIRLSAEACEAQVGLAILIGVICGAIAASITAICIVCTYKKKSRSEKYPLERYASLNLTVNNDIFMGSFVTRRVIRSSSGGRSGGFGGGGGGGGGHRGGR